MNNKNLSLPHGGNKGLIRSYYTFNFQFLNGKYVEYYFADDFEDEFEQARCRSGASFDLFSRLLLDYIKLGDANVESLRVSRSDDDVVVVKIITEGTMAVDFEGLQKAYADKDVVIFADCSGERPKIISSGIIHPIPSEPRPKWIIKGLL